MNIRAVIFDIYGTLLEVGPALPDADARWQRLFSDLFHTEPNLSRLDFSIATNRVIARHHEEARARCIPWPEVHWPSIVAEVIPELTRLSRQEQEEFLFHQIQTGHTTRLTAETAAALRWLKEQECPLGLASNAQTYTWRELSEALATHGLGLELFERSLCFWSADHGFSKPDPHVFQILTARLTAFGIAAREILMVGDHMENDIEPARAQGWQTWHLNTKATVEDGEAGDWRELDKYLHQKIV